MSENNAVLVKTGKGQGEYISLTPKDNGIEMMIVFQFNDHLRSVKTVLTPEKVTEFLNCLKMGKSSRMFSANGDILECHPTIFKESKYVPGRRIKISNPKITRGETLINYDSIELISNFISGWFYFHKDLMAMEQVKEEKILLEEENDLMLDEIILLQDKIVLLEKEIAQKKLPARCAKQKQPSRRYALAG